jgi:hypothetical protein
MFGRFYPKIEHAYTTNGGIEVSDDGQGVLVVKQTGIADLVRRFHYRATKSASDGRRWFDGLTGFSGR